jgi:hypothetical protein
MTDKRLALTETPTDEPASYYRDTLSDVIAELKATAEADSPGDPTSIAAQAAERLEAMSAALRPFSVEYGRYENEDGTNFIGNSRLRVGDLRLAGAALAKAVGNKDPAHD